MAMVSERGFLGVLATRPVRILKFPAILLAAIFAVYSGFSDQQWHQESGYRWANLELPQEGRTGFTLLAPGQTGIDFTNILLEFSGATNRILHNGAGVALGDYDHDGRLDIFVCGLDSPSALYRNLGNWHFTNVTAASCLSFHDRYQRGAVFADVNGDGALDLMVSTLNRGVLVFLNDGHGHFKDVTAEAGTATGYGSVTMALADIDGDGTLDLYVANNRAEDIRNRGRVQIYQRNGQYVIPPDLKDRLAVVNGAVREYGEPDVMYLNDGKGHFKPVSWTDGRFLDEQGQPLKRTPLDWGQTVALRDLNDDGAPDIYVCNDYWTIDRLWINDGHGKFRAIARDALRHVPFSSMGVDFADINRDGYLDFLVTDMQSRDPRLRKRQIFAYDPRMPVYDPMAPPEGVVADRPQIMRNTLFLNRGDNTYADIAEYAGLASADWAWQQIFLDVDLDGYEDLLISAGYFRDVQDRDAISAISARKPSLKGFTNEEAFQLAFSMEKMTNARLYPPYQSPIMAYRNEGNLKFEEVTAQWGTDQPGIRQGLAIGDLDNDGDMDLVVNIFNGALGVYRNNSIAPRVAVRLKGLPPNTQGIGAKIKLLNGAVPMQSQEVICGGRYLSGSEPMLVFAAGHAKQGMSIEVNWRSGKRSVIRDVAPNRIYEVDETAANTVAPARTQPKPCLFVDVSEALGHTHHEEPFDDFARQPLLPRKLSQLGPGVAWWDLNRDGHEDLIIASGKGGQLAVFLGDGRGGFQRTNSSLTVNPVPRNQTAVLGFNPSLDQTAILTALANYEDGKAEGPCVRQYNWTSNTLAEMVEADASSVGPLLLGDIDGNGTLDLFVGGRVIPGRWPEPASSRLYRNTGNKFVLDTENSALLTHAGLVTGAVFSDLDGDGFPELILACEWGPVRIFHNDHGRLSEWNPPVDVSKLQVQPSNGASSLSQLTGWWNGVCTADLDGDGRMDIIASNWGLNSPYRASAQHPVEVYYGDLSGQGLVDVIETEYEPELNAVAPRRYRDALTASLPFIAGRFPTHKAYSEATLDDVLGEARTRANMVRAVTLATTVFLNRGDHFEAVPLPAEAQFSPAFAVTVADFNGDGCEDLFLSQNFFAAEPGIPRLDAGRGLLLFGDGKGGLRAVPGQESGIKIYGEQRGAAVADFDEDGRPDLVVTQNGGQTRLFKNTQAKPGIRVTLQGPALNSRGIGAVMRLKFGERIGPARELHAGSGYLSQDSAIAVLAVPEPATSLWIRWPGGKVTTTTLPENAQEVVVNEDGKLLR
jgi:hypothetical protein